jgi:hypothetical protein
MLFRQAVGTVVSSRRFTPDGSMFDHEPHAERAVELIDSQW